MISPIFTTVVIGFLAIMIYMKTTTNRFNTGDDQLIEEESRANAVRKKSLDDLDYISIPFEKLPFSQTSVDENKGSAPPDSLSSNTDDVLRQDENEILRLKDSRTMFFMVMVRGKRMQIRSILLLKELQQMPPGLQDW